MSINFQYLKSIAPGIILALVFCLFSQGINNVLAIEIFGTPKSPISTVLIAILLGILMGNAFTPRLRPKSCDVLRVFSAICEH